MSRGVVDMRDWALHRDVERLIELAGPRGVTELLVELRQVAMVRTQAEITLRRFVDRLSQYKKQRA
jgi:hypothetical protein